jgi:predicted nucleic acid-binding protein
MIVIDASALVEVLLQSSGASAVEAWMARPGQTLHAPHLIDLEVAQVVRRYVMVGRIDQRLGQIALINLEHMPVHRYSHGALLPRIWTLRSNLSAYDAAYISLAEALNAPLLTRDRRLAAAPGHRATIALA